LLTNSIRYGIDLLQAINQRYVSRVALIGYSHGGGEVYDLSAAMSNSQWAGFFTSPYSVIFPSYIDAIGQPLLGSVNLRPVGSVYHVNQYQQNSLILQGDSNNGNVDVDRSILGLTHTSIDDSPAVLGILTRYFRKKVVR